VSFDRTARIISLRFSVSVRLMMRAAWTDLN
jgi:hypothetical protein